MFFRNFKNLASVKNRWNFAKRRRGGEDKRIKVIQVKVMIAVGKVVFQQLAINVRLLQAVVRVPVRHIQMNTYLFKKRNTTGLTCTKIYVLHYYWYTALIELKQLQIYHGSICYATALRTGS